MKCKVWFIAGIVATLAISGCSPATRYRTLSFFFDGVPVPEAMKAHEEKTTTEEKTGSLKLSETSKVYSHGPYAAKMCESCHESGGGQLLLPVEELCFKCHELKIKKRKIHGPVASGGCRVCHHPHGSGKAYNLVAEPTALCFTCHEEADIMSHEVHRTSAGTQCTVCHNPHASDNDFMLK